MGCVSVGILRQWRETEKDWSLISADLVVYSRTGWEDRHSPEGKGCLCPAKSLRGGVRGLPAPIGDRVSLSVGLGCSHRAPLRYQVQDR